MLQRSPANRITPRQLPRVEPRRPAHAAFRRYSFRVGCPIGKSATLSDRHTRSSGLISEPLLARCTRNKTPERLVPSGRTVCTQGGVRQSAATVSLGLVGYEAPTPAGLADRPVLRTGGAELPETVSRPEACSRSAHQGAETYITLIAALFAPPCQYAFSGIPTGYCRAAITLIRWAITLFHASAEKGYSPPATTLHAPGLSPTLPLLHSP